MGSARSLKNSDGHQPQGEGSFEGGSGLAPLCHLPPALANPLRLAYSWGMNSLRTVLIILVVSSLGLVGCVAGSGGPTDTRWPVSDTGKPAFYYFGTPG